MNAFLTLAFLFLMGSVTGWVIELFFRRFYTKSNPEKKWVNPGFCMGPYLPLYGFGLCMLYVIASLEKYSFVSDPFRNKIILFAVMAICMTAIEYVTGILCLKISHVRLWDYSNERFNIQGIICPKFSLMWAALGALYYFLIHPSIVGALDWLSKNLAFSFVIGMFFGVLIIDVIHSSQLVVKLKRFSLENDVIIRYETIKQAIRVRYDETKDKYNFFRPFKSDRPLTEHLKELTKSFETKIFKKRK